MKYLLYLLLSLSLNAQSATLAAFTQHPAKTEDNLLAIIDLSEYSLKWLALNKSYLIKKNIPILVLSANDDQTFALIQKYPGLLAGAVPPPAELTERLFEQIGLKHYPAVIENNIIWQVKP